MSIALITAALIASPLDDIALALLAGALLPRRKGDKAPLASLFPNYVTSSNKPENQMAATSKNVNASFDINAYLASTTERTTLAAKIGEVFASVAIGVERATEDLSHKISYSVGDGVGASDGLGDVYELGKKVGVIRSKVRTESFRARAEQEIRDLLAQG